MPQCTTPSTIQEANENLKAHNRKTKKKEKIGLSGNCFR
jgi:hypothetical protein